VESLTTPFLSLARTGTEDYRAFRGEEKLNQALALRSRKNWEGNQIRPWTSEFFERNLPAALKGHGSVLTHGDIQGKNILVEQLRVEGHDDERRFRVSAVLDWEDAGWYPSYWEYAASFVDFVWVDDWPEKVESILDPYPLESAMLKIVRQDLDY
jgi:thiamine kinase-like enzyme